jgi:hypothetical protein
VKSKNVVQTSERVFFEIFQKICQKGRGKRLNFPELDYLLLHVAKNSKILKKKLPSCLSCSQTWLHPPMDGC